MNTESSKPSQSDALDELIFSGRKLEAVQLLRELRGYGIAEATEALGLRYRELRMVSPARFTCEDEQYWQGFYS